MSNNTITNVRSGNTQLDIFSIENKKFIFPVLDISEDPCGQCCIIYDASGHCVIMDTARTASLQNIIDAMLQADIKVVDAIFISHWHIDHYENVEQFALYFDCTDTIYYLGRPSANYPGTDTQYQHIVALYGDRAVTPNNGATYEHLGMSFEINNNSLADVAYYDANSNDYNDYSMVVTIKYDQTTAIFPGDLGLLGQERAVINGYVSEADLLVWPHHGVNYSSYNDFPLVINPEFVYISDSTGPTEIHNFRDPALFATHARIFNNVMNRATGVCFVTTGESFAASGSPFIFNKYGVDRYLLHIDASVASGAVQNGGINTPFKNARAAIGASTKNSSLYFDTAYNDTLTITSSDPAINIVGNDKSITTYLTIDGGKAMINNAIISGGCQIINNGDVVFNNCTFTSTIVVSNSEAIFTNCTFTAASGTIITGTNSKIILESPTAANRTGLLLSATRCIIAGSFALGSVNAAQLPIFSFIASMATVGRLSDSLAILQGIYANGGAPDVMYDTTNNRFIHILSDGTVRGAATT